MPSNHLVFSCIQPFSEAGSFPMSQFFISGSQSTGTSALTSVLPMNTQDWFPFLLTCLISLLSKGLLWVFSSTTVQKHQLSDAQLSLWSSTHIYTWLEKNIAFTRWTFLGTLISLLFNMLSRLVIAFLPRSKHLNFMATVTICSDFGAQENKVFHCFHCFPIYLSWSDGTLKLNFQRTKIMVLSLHGK